MGMDITPHGGPLEFEGIEIHWGYSSSNHIADAIGIAPFATEDACSGSMPTHELLVACGTYLRTARPEYVFPTDIEHFNPGVGIRVLSEIDTVRRVKNLYDLCAAALWQGHTKIVWG